MWGLHFLTVLMFVGYTPSTLSQNVRLVGGSSRSHGRVEIYHQGEWGTVCHDGWGVDDARVVCRQLGLSGDATPTTSAFFGEGSGQIWLNNVRCSGSEANLGQCQSDGWGSYYCDHSEDAGVVCGTGVCSPTCRNGGICSSTNTCTCGSGYTGSHCQTPSWGSWGSWGACSQSCGGGTKTRYRTCPRRGACSGSSTRSTSCNTDNCPDKCYVCQYAEVTAESGDVTMAAGNGNCKNNPYSVPIEECTNGCIKLDGTRSEFVEGQTIRKQVIARECLDEDFPIRLSQGCTEGDDFREYINQNPDGVGNDTELAGSLCYCRGNKCNDSVSVQPAILVMVIVVLGAFYVRN